MGLRGKKALILFARKPELGKVKTRLQPLLGPEDTLNLYSCFLQDSIDKIFSFEEADHFVGAYPSLSSDFINKGSGSGKMAGVFAQEGDDLGERMKNAFMKFFAEGYDQVVIIGADSPTLPVSYIADAFKSEKQVVIGPSADGGYYLVGMNRKLTDIFANVSWGTERALSQTMELLRQNGTELTLLPLWYDVDRPEDLKFLKTHMDLMAQAGVGRPEATGAFIDKLKL